VRTYAHEVVMRIPADVHLDDPAALAELGRNVARTFVETDKLPPAERERAAEQLIRQLFESAAVA
jgi:hypothetical protein